MSSDRGKLGTFLEEIISWTWAEFCVAEKDPKYSGYQAAVFALVRTASDAKLGAIKLAIDRIDGKLETPLKYEYPKVFFLYPEASRLASPTPADAAAHLALFASSDPLPPPEEEIEEEQVTAATLTLRQTLEKMVDAPRATVPMILKRKSEVEHDPHSYINTLEEDANVRIPLVKSVIVANLLNLANEKHNFEAITEVFDQIDGKLVETIRLLGDDFYITQYALEAPYGAVKNKEGIYMLEAKEISDQWRQKLEPKRT